MITLGREKLMRHMLLGVHEVTTSSHMVQFAVVISEKLTLKYL